mmetsp:Transcript_17109/g.51477  ORF Transcript_17109/g.51477 Transcript_17109/m.51477 type:complete len:268 (+) Transcript_17109:471-1274(+)
MIRSKWTIRVAEVAFSLSFSLSLGATKKNHHSSNFGSGNSGACVGPIASFSPISFRSICTVTVATSPTTISDSSSTSMFALSSISPTYWQKASTSASWLGISLSMDLRCSASVSRNSARVVTFAARHLSTFSSWKCGTWSSCELFTSSACTRHRRKSSIACAVANHSRMQAISIMACVIFMECFSSSSQSFLISGVMREWRRCMCAQTRNWFFITTGRVKERLLCSTTCPPSFCMCSWSIGRMTMARLSALAARSSGPALRRVDSLM